MQATLPPRKEYFFYCSLTAQQRNQYLDETNRILCHDFHEEDSILSDENENENENRSERNYKKLKKNNHDDSTYSKTSRSKNLYINGNRKGVLPNIMKLRQICNFAEFTDFEINGNGSTEFNNRECALQFLEHSAKLKVRHSNNILKPFNMVCNYYYYYHYFEFYLKFF